MSLIKCAPISSVGSLENVGLIIIIVSAALHATINLNIENELVVCALVEEMVLFEFILVGGK